MCWTQYHRILALRPASGCTLGYCAKYIISRWSGSLRRTGMASCPFSWGGGGYVSYANLETIATSLYDTGRKFTFALHMLSYCRISSFRESLTGGYPLLHLWHLIPQHRDFTDNLERCWKWLPWPRKSAGIYFIGPEMLKGNSSAKFELRI